MPYISKITLPSGTQYDIKDAEARAQIAALTGGDAVVFIGVSETQLTDGGNQIPYINDVAQTPATGNIYFYGSSEFIRGADGHWHELGNLSSLGALAYHDSVTVSYTPSGEISQPTFTGSSSSVTISVSDNANGNYQPKGTVSQPTFSGTSFISTGSYTPSGDVSLTNTNKTATVSPAGSGTATYTPAGSVTAPTISVKTAGSTTTIKNPTSTTVAKTVVAAAPGATAPANSIVYYAVNNENLSLYQLGYTTGASITTANVTVKTGDAAYESSQPTFQGTGVRLVTGNIAVPTSASFSGSAETISVSGTPTGTVSQPTFTGQKAQFTGTTTAAGTVSTPEFQGYTAIIDFDPNEGAGGPV